MPPPCRYLYQEIASLFVEPPYSAPVTPLMTPYRQPFSLTEELVNTAVPVNGPSRQRFITRQQQSWKSLPISSLKHHPDDINTAAELLSAIAFSDFTTPIPVSSNTSSPQRQSTRRRCLYDSLIISGTRVAVTADLENEWFLATVLESDGDEYIVKDDDFEEGDPKTFKVHRSCIRVLPSPNQFLDPGWRVLAVYPDTTTFYPATVIRRKGRHWVVRFDDDDDDEEDDDVDDYDHSPDDDHDGRLVDASFIFKL